MLQAYFVACAKNSIALVEQYRPATETRATILISPIVLAGKIANAYLRSAPFIDDTAVLLQLQIREERTGQIVAAPVFYDAAPAKVSPAADDSMMHSVALQACAYIRANR